MHQSARDGFRSYLQAYASYSLKKIFDINKLDLARVGKSFGFSVPPRVNLNIGGGKGSSGTKRKRSEVDGVEEEVWEEMPIGSGAESEEEMEVDNSARQGKERRIESLGKKIVDKERYRKVKELNKAKASGWS